MTKELMAQAQEIAEIFERTNARIALAIAGIERLRDERDEVSAEVSRLQKENERLRAALGDMASSEWPTIRETALGLRAIARAALAESRQDGAER